MKIKFALIEFSALFSTVHQKRFSLQHTVFTSPALQDTQVNPG